MREPGVLGKLRLVWHRAATTGSPMPPEEQLAVELGVSKPSLREALARLEAEGLVTRRIGAGTFPNPLALEMPARLDQETDFAGMLRSAGFEPTLEVLDAGWTELTEHQAVLLERPAGTMAYRTEKRWAADGVPVMVALDVIPVRRAPEPEPDPSITLVDLAAHLGAGRAEWICTWPGAVNCGSAAAGQLQIAPGDAVLTLEHVGVDRHGRRAFWAFEHHRPGYLRYGLILNV